MSLKTSKSTKSQQTVSKKLALDRIAVMTRDAGPVAEAAWGATYDQICPYDPATSKDAFNPRAEAAHQITFTRRCLGNRVNQAKPLLIMGNDTRLLAMLKRTTHCRPAGGYIALKAKPPEEKTDALAYHKMWQGLLSHTCDRIHFCPFCHYRKAEELAGMIARNNQRPAVMIRLKFPCDLDELNTYLKTTLAPYVRTRWLNFENALIVRPLYSSLLGAPPGMPLNLRSWEVNLWLAGHKHCPKFKPNILHEFLDVQELKPSKIDLAEAVRQIFAFPPALVTTIRDDTNLHYLRKYYNFVYTSLGTPRRCGVTICRMFAKDKPRILPQQGLLADPEAA